MNAKGATIVMEATLNGPYGRTPLGAPGLTIGRGPQNQLVMQDVKASTRHVEIRWSDQGYSIVDLGSTNGTFVNEQRIAPNAPLLLKANDSVRIGDTRFTYEVSGTVQVGSTVRDQPMQQNVPGYNPTMAAVPPVAPNVQPPVYPGYNPAAMPNVQPPVYPGYNPAAMSSPYMNYQNGFVPPPPPSMQGPKQQAQLLSSAEAGQWLQRQLPKKYWRVFLGGLAAYIIIQSTLYQTGNLNFIPLLIFLASLLVPVTFVIFCWEQGASLDIPLSTIGLVFASGATMGLVVAGILENNLLANATQGAFITVLIVGLCEEAAKAVALVWFLGNKRLHSEMHGLILGVTVGMGFAAFETAGYGFHYFLAAFASAGGSGNALATAIAVMINVLNTRMALAIFGHGVWAAIVAAAIWRERGTSSFKLTSGVWFAYGISVFLHALWDYAGFIAFALLVGLAGLVVLRFFIIDARVHAKLGPSAPPLFEAFKYYLAHMFERYPYPVPLPNTP